MKKSDLYYEANASGYIIFYKHRCIGGGVNPEPVSHGKKGSRQKKAMENQASLDIKFILEGRGEQRYHDKINHIDASFEKYRKRD